VKLQAQSSKLKKSSNFQASKAAGSGLAVVVGISFGGLTFGLGASRRIRMSSKGISIAKPVSRASEDLVLPLSFEL
jgi:hypothetical protein